jgi:hypothetical protein
MNRKSSFFVSVAVATVAMVAMAGSASATSDRCIQLEEQFASVAGEHASNPKLPLAQSYEQKGSYLCNNDVDDIGEETLEQALRLLGVEPDPLP